MARSHNAPGTVASGRRGIPWRAAGLALAAMLAFTGSGVITAELATRSVLSQSAPVLAPPQPAPGLAPPAVEPQVDRDETEDVRDLARVGMPPAAPTEIRIPRIGVDAEIMNVGIDQEGMVEVPPLEEAQLAGWYERGPAPGDVGNSVIVGHVDSYATGPAVFFALGALEPGDLIEVGRADDSVATFAVDGLATYPKSEFPNEMIYGSSDQASLRVITCGGRFDRVTGEYPDNVVVFATLVDDDGLSQT